jgi:hypothetical protein
MYNVDGQQLLQHVYGYTYADARAVLVWFNPKY